MQWNPIPIAKIHDTVVYLLYFSLYKLITLLFLNTKTKSSRFFVACYILSRFVYARQPADKVERYNKPTTATTEMWKN